MIVARAAIPMSADKRGPGGWGVPRTNDRRLQLDLRFPFRGPSPKILGRHVLKIFGPEPDPMWVGLSDYEMGHRKRHLPGGAHKFAVEEIQIKGRHRDQSNRRNT
jgi:hypothetical protein